MKHLVDHTNIYTLTDPRNGLVRYVGKANNVHQRFKAHLNKARKHQIHKERWVNQLKKEGLKPIIDVIDIVPIEEWKEWETYWISQMKTWGFDLINYTSGGDGCTFGNQTSFKPGNKARSVLAIDLNGNIVERFDSLKLAELKYGKNVSHVVLGIGKTASGLVFVYEDKYTKQYANELIENAKTYNFTINAGNFKKGCISIACKKVGMYSLDGTLIKYFESALQASIFIGVKAEKIRRLCTTSKKKIFNNKTFKYET